MVSEMYDIQLMLWFLSFLLLKLYNTSSPHYIQWNVKTGSLGYIVYLTVDLLMRIIVTVPYINYL